MATESLPRSTKPKYVMVGGDSKADGDVHYVSPLRLCVLYGVDSHDCILADRFDSPNLRGLHLEDYVVLGTRDGDYKLP